jgi:hypothetical protein
VRRVLNEEERGVYVLSFGSVDTFDALTDLTREGKRVVVHLQVLQAPRKTCFCRQCC